MKDRDLHSSHYPVAESRLDRDETEGDDSKLFRREVDAISRNLDGVLERIQYVDLIAQTMKMLRDKLTEDGMIVFEGQLHTLNIFETLFDNYGLFNTQDVGAFIDKLLEYPDLAYKYFEEHWKDMDYTKFASNLREAGLFLRRAEIALVPLKRLAKEIEAETDPTKRQQLAARLEEMLNELLSNSSFNIVNRHGMKPLTIDRMYRKGSDEWIYDDNDYSSGMSDYLIEEIAVALQKARFEQKFLATVGTIDRDKIAQETKTYGAKGAHLQAVADVINNLQQMSSMLEGRCMIPDFKRIPVAVYRKWKNGENIQGDLREYYNWIKGRAVMVRSSAVFSEDNEDTTGAGIYESLDLDENATFEDFEHAVIAVFESVDSERAQQYREENGIDSEEMGIVLQEFVPYKRNKKGYVNTVVMQVPELMDIVLEGSPKESGCQHENGLRPVINKEVLERWCVKEGEDRSMFHYQIDSRKYGLQLQLLLPKLAIVAFLLEKYYGTAIQIEFIFTQKEDSSSISGKRNTIAILQTRILPKNYSQPAEVEFPEQEPLFEGRALGIADVTLDILPNKENNSKKEGIVIFESSKFGSFGRSFADHNFPKTGVVVVLGAPEEIRGHIETLCAERGIKLIFCDGYKNTFNQSRFEALSGNKYGQPIDEFRGHKRLRVVMDGLEGRIYPPSS